MGQEWKQEGSLNNYYKRKAEELLQVEGRILTAQTILIKFRAEKTDRTVSRCSDLYAV